MAGWNHRVMKHENPLLHDHDTMDTCYIIHEVYYDDNDEPNGWTVDAAAVSGDNIKELRETLERMLACLDKPILDYGDD